MGSNSLRAEWIPLRGPYNRPRKCPRSDQRFRSPAWPRLPLCPWIFLGCPLGSPPIPLQLILSVFKIKWIPSGSFTCVLSLKSLGLKLLIEGINAPNQSALNVLWIEGLFHPRRKTIFDDGNRIRHFQPRFSPDRWLHRSRVVCFAPAGCKKE